MTQHLALLFVFLGASPPGGPDPSKEPAARIAALPPGGCAGAPEDLVPGRNPRFLPDGRRLVFEVGRPGAADLHVLDLGTRAVTPLVVGPGDDCDADPAPDGSQVVFASSRGGSYDLWVVPVEGGAPRRLTDHPGDERRPRWSPVAYRLLGVHPEGCGGPYTSLLDEYGKILYERREGKQTDTLWVSANGLHAGPLARGCAAPSWLPFGRGVLLACGGRVAVLETARVAGVEGAIQASGWSQESWQRDGFPRDEIELDGLDDAALEDFLRQFPSIRRLYTVYEGSRELSGPRDLLERPASSPNGLLVVAESARGGVRARVAAEGAEWGPLGLPEDARGAAWSPDGTRVAFHRAAPGGDRLLVAPTGCPLQRVLNLHQEPLLTRGGVSSRLDRHGWVARPGDHKEFFHLYEELRYAGAGILVTPDAVLQVASDLLAAGIQEREMAMIVALRDLTEGIWTFARESLRAAPRDPVRRYLATWAAVPRILLGFAATRQAALEEEGGECILVQDMGCPEDMTELRAAWEAKLGRRLAEEEARLLGEVPDAIRDDVAGLLERVRGATGIGRYEPGALGQPQGFAVDWTLFTPRSHYTGPQFRDYFLAMSWYGNLPLPAHPLALQIADRILGDPVLGALWKDLDGFAGAAVGDPARPTLHHLAAARGAHPGWVKEVAAQDLLADLAARLGPIPVRGANETFGYPGMQPYLLPPRLGVDVGVLVRLTHPAVALRGMPSALDVLAALGNHLAEALSGAPPVGEGWTAGAFADALRTARDDLAGRGPGFWAENLYNRWMDMLRILADDAGIRGIATPRWAGSDLYRARLLTTALAGLSQIKHHTVLYNMNPMGVECDGGSPVVVLYEEPVLPPPPMAVEPHPEFYAAVAAFAAAADTALAAAPAPALDREEARSLLLETTWDPAGSLFRMPEGTFAGGPLGSFFQGLGLLAGFLEEASQRTLEGRPLEPEHQLLVQYLGGILERFVLRQDYLEDSMIRGADQGRTERGITLVTDIYHNPMRDQVLELGVGLVDRVYAVVPWLQGEGLVQGGMFSWYEFPEDGARRLTDQAWWERLQEGALPPRPPWSRLYLEEAE